MEVMEEGNIMDRVNVLLQRDMAYYQENQTVLTEKLCPGVAGGPLDFPRHTSFAAYKLVTWWEEAYTTAFGKSSGLLAGDPSKEAEVEVEACPTPAQPPSTRPPTAVNTTTAKQRRSDFFQLTSASTHDFLEHLHALSQEALDHADLGVLSATLGAAALLRSCLWCYQRLLPPAAEPAPVTTDSLVTAHHKMHELAEALAERLLDLHCRLLSLYVLQEAQSLDWEASGAFAEGERSSFTIQMWWLYMQGVRHDLWTSIPPATAQRVLAGVLNESLTILVARYWHARPSAARASQLNGDVSNLLQCVFALLPALSADASYMTGSNMSDAGLKDVHSKCRRLLTILVLRGAPLRSLHAAFRRGLESTAAVRKPNRNLLRSERGDSEAWLRLAGGASTNQSDGDAVALEMAVLLAQPQPNWPLLVKVLMMRNHLLSKAILKMLMVDEAELTMGEEYKDVPSKGCGLFLCAGDCDCGLQFGSSTCSWRSALEEALVLILAAAGGGAALTSALQPVLSVSSMSWGTAMDRSHLWSPHRPPWLTALLLPLAPVVRPAVECLEAAAAAGAPNCDLPSITIRCLIELAACVPAWAVAAANAIADESPADVRPAGGTPLTHLLLAALYESLMAKTSPVTAIVAEVLCHADSNETLQPLLATLRRTLNDMSPPVDVCGITSSTAFGESTIAGQLAAERVSATSQGRRSLAILLLFLKAKGPSLLPTNKDGATAEAIRTAEKSCGPAKLLQAMFYVGDKHFDQLLAGSWQPDWAELLQEPLGLSRSELWKQLQLRPEFRADGTLDRHDAAVVEAVVRLFDDCRETIAHDIVFSESDDSDLDSDLGPVTLVELPQSALKSNK